MDDIQPGLTDACSKFSQINFAKRQILNRDLNRLLEVFNILRIVSPFENLIKAKTYLQRGNDMSVCVCAHTHAHTQNFSSNSRRF